MTPQKKAHEALLQGISLHQANRLAEAIVCYEKAILLQKDNAIAYSNLALAMQSLGDFSRATSNFKKAIAIKPDFDQAHYNFAVLKQE
ncbi:MAG: tetratricopeptide repeat protein [Magnetococcales bacterium]|nr:tetratricopeptide repeat protein [Magnetococcales bacterium]